MGVRGACMRACVRACVCVCVFGSIPSPLDISSRSNQERLTGRQNPRTCQLPSIGPCRIFGFFSSKWTDIDHHHHEHAHDQTTLFENELDFAVSSAIESVAFFTLFGNQGFVFLSTCRPKRNDRVI